MSRVRPLLACIFLSGALLPVGQAVAFEGSQGGIGLFGRHLGGAGVSFISMGGYIGYLDQAPAEALRSLLMHANLHYAYFDPEQVGASRHMPTFETPILGLGWGRLADFRAGSGVWPVAPAGPSGREATPRLGGGSSPPPGNARAWSSPLGDPGGLPVPAPPGGAPTIATPVPEPAAYMLMGLGLLAVAWVTRVRRAAGMPQVRY
jgi:hypothetical protein